MKRLSPSVAIIAMLILSACALPTGHIPARHRGMSGISTAQPTPQTTAPPECGGQLPSIGKTCTTVFDGYKITFVRPSLNASVSATVVIRVNEDEIWFINFPANSAQVANDKFVVTVDRDNETYVISPVAPNCDGVLPPRPGDCLVYFGQVYLGDVHGWSTEATIFTGEAFEFRPADGGPNIVISGISGHAKSTSTLVVIDGVTYRVTLDWDKGISVTTAP